MQDNDSYNKPLHYFAIVVAIAVVLLITSGSIVTTIGAGLAVPDWPLSFGSVNPDGWWQDTPVRTEHGHRLVGATVGILTLILFAWMLIVKAPRSVRLAGGICVVAVIVQGTLGGLRVTDRNIGFAMIHACLAQAFFCLVVYLCVALSRGWTQHSIDPARPDRGIPRLLIAVVVGIYVQLIIGSIMRHTAAGLAIPTFPLVDGGLWPTQWTFPIAIHYVHRVWAGAIAILVIAAVTALQRRNCRGRAMAAAWLMLVLTIVQLALGATIILTHRAAVPTSAHVVTGALLLACSLYCLLWFSRDRSGP